MPMPVIGIGIALNRFILPSAFQNTPGTSWITSDWPAWNWLTRACGLLTIWKVICAMSGGPVNLVAGGFQL